MANLWRDFALDASGDLEFDGQDFALVSGTEAIRQQLQIALSLWAGEYPFDVTLGVDWSSILNVKGVDEQQIASEVQKVALSVQGVTAIDSIAVSVDKETRAATITVSAIGNGEKLLVIVQPQQEV